MTWGERVTTCHTFVHHVDRDLRAECAQHPEWIVDVPPQPKGEPSARAITDAARAEHEGEHR